MAIIPLARASPDASIAANPGTSGGQPFHATAAAQDIADAPNGLPQGPSNVYVVSRSVHDINRGCLYTDAWDADLGPVVFAGNEVYNYDGAAMAAAGESGGRLHDVVFANNVVYRTADKVEGFGSTAMAFGYNWGSEVPELENIAAVNNTSYNMPWAWARIDYDEKFPGVVSELFFVNNLCALAGGRIVSTDKTTIKIYRLATWA